jgi:Spy/CpxP family protein refolding chaperone
MMLRRSCFLALPLVFACNNPASSGGTAASSTAPVTQASSAAAASSPVASASASAGHGDKHGPGGGGGMSGMLFHAARDLGLSPDVAAKVDAAQEPLRGDDPAQGDSFKTFHTDLVAMVKAGKMDTAKVTADEAAIDAAMKVHDDTEAAALNGLHDALSSDQRKALVAAVQAKQGERDAKDAQKAPPPDAGPADFAAKRLAEMTTDLGLDAGQQKQVQAILLKQAPPAPAQMQAMKDAMKAKMAAVLTAFAGDTFDAKKLEPFATWQGPRQMMDKHVAVLTQLLPILHDDQRAKLADEMDKTKGRMMMGGHGGHDDDGEHDQH